jgi:uncharacterized protein (TIGR03067 family)
MQRIRLLFGFAGLALLTLALGVSPARAESRYTTKSWEGQREDVTLEKEAPASRAVGNKEDFAALWKAWMGKDKLPEIDFEKEFVVILTSKTFVINSVALQVEQGHAYAVPVRKKDEKREVKGLAFAMGVFPREGITTFNGKPLPGPTLADDLRREVNELRAQVAELERRLDEPEIKQLRGTWRLSTGMQAGEVPKGLEKALIEILDRKITIKTENDEKPQMFGTILRVDPTQQPATMDLGYDGEEGILKGIYKLDKEVLKLCFSQPGRDRPREFSSKKGENTILLVLQRAPK